MEKLLKIITDIENLERENMTPILSEMGQHFDPQKIQDDIVQNNPGLANTYVVYSRQHELLGYFRYNQDGENSIIVKSIQVSKDSNKWFVVKKLLQIAYTVLYYSTYLDSLKITSWVFNHNLKSIKFQESLGFKYDSATKDAIKYSTTKKQLLDKLAGLGLKMNFTPYTHPGLFPVRVLQHNLIHTIENHTSNRIEELRTIIKEGKIKPGIKYGISNGKFKSIQIDPEEKVIKVEEQFLAFLWSFIYSTFVIYEEGIQTPSIKNGGTFTGHIDNSKPITKRAFQLFDWSIALPVNFNFWPMKLANPEAYHTAEEQFYCEKVNGIYQRTVAYLCNHEIAHLVNNHWEVLKNIKLTPEKNRTQAQKDLYKEIEGDADAYARQILVDLANNDNTKLIDGVSIIYAHLASFFLLNHPKDLMDNLHPDLDIRLSNTLDYLNFDEPQNKDYVYLLGYMILHYFFTKWESELENIEMVYTFPLEYNKPKDCFDYALDFINQVKEKYIELENGH